MKTFDLKQLMIYLTLVLIFFPMIVKCDKGDHLPPFHAKGKIFLITSWCWGEVVYIEVEEPDGIGSTGNIFFTEDTQITYKNAIGVPYFTKIRIPDSVPQSVGTKLYFEYRELTEEEKENIYLFRTDTPIACPSNIAPYDIKRFIIKEVFSYE